ncbi:MAG: family 10 glycosylhydrolase [Acholeplasmataceae bacterium]
MDGIKRVFAFCFVFIFLGMMVACEDTTEADETYVIRFVSEDTAEIDEIEAEALSLVELPVLERPGYVFKGWYEEGDEETLLPSSLRVDRDYELIARWEPELFSIGYDTNGGEEIEDQEVGFETSIETAVPTRQGYTFEGWFFDEELTDRFDLESMPMHDLVLYAKWSINTYEIDFDSNGGSQVDPIEAEYGAPIAEPDPPTRTNHEFLGWFTDAELSEPFDAIHHYDTSDPVMVPTEYTEKTTELRGVWVATVYNLNMPVHTSKTQYKAEFRTVLDRVIANNMNAVFFQVRPLNDAFYDSDFAPWSRYLTGTEGEDPGWDVLQFMIDECHEHGIEFHAWMNPYRVANSTSDKSTYLDTLAPDNFARQNPDLVVAGEKDGDTNPYILNPGEPEVQSYIRDVVIELVSEYDVDGIHFDDYFYPYSGISSDTDTYDAYHEDGQSIEAFRRESVNTAIRGIKEDLDGFNDAMGKNVRFGISPFGLWASGLPGYSQTLPGGSNTGPYNLSSYHAQYADSKKWVEEGWLDYIAPQVYWPFSHSTAPYADVVDWWAEIVQGTGVDLLIGHSISGASSGGWATDEIAMQLRYNQKYDVIKGSIMYSADFLTQRHMGEVSDNYWVDKPDHVW